VVSPSLRPSRAASRACDGKAEERGDAGIVESTATQPARVMDVAQQAMKEGDTT
jgi:hypothetical protein